MAISRERDTATHQPRDTKARRRRRILGRIAEPPALSVCGACAGRRRQTDVSLRGPQGGAAQRSAGRGSGERAPPAHPASREPGRRAARRPAAAARPSSAAGSPAATWTRVYVEFDDLEWDKREWVRVYEDFSTFLVEYHLIWARRNDPSQTQGSKSKQIQWPALVRCVSVSLSIFSLF